jgi:hypothetical protein
VGRLGGDAECWGGVPRHRLRPRTSLPPAACLNWTLNKYVFHVGRVRSFGSLCEFCACSSTMRRVEPLCQAKPMAPLASGVLFNQCHSLPYIHYLTGSSCSAAGPKDSARWVTCKQTRAG